MAKQNNTSSQISTQSAEEQDIPEVQNELSKVATNPKQSILILLVISAVFIFIFFKLFITDNKPTEVVTPSAPTDITKPTQDNSKNLPEIPKLPEAPKLETPVELPPPPPPKVADVPKLPLPTTSVDNNSADKLSLPSVVSSSPLPGGIAESDEEKKRREAKRKSSIVLIAGVPEKKTPSQIAEEANFQDRGDMAFVLGRGKIIEAVLETAINSDLGGEVRAIISRDVFSEREKIILIPKGSKIFGAYTTGIDGAYGRIAIIWNRIDLSNGYTITLCPDLTSHIPLARDNTRFLFNYKRAAYKRSNFDIIVASKWMQDMVNNSPMFENKLVHLVPFGLDINFFSAAACPNARKLFDILEDALVICFRVEQNEFKGIPYIIQALERIKSKQPICLLTLSSGGALLQQFADRFQLVNLGWTNDEELVRDALVAADIFLMPSIAETFGMMAVEAMVCGKPVIVFEGTSLPDVTFAPDVGLAVPMRDGEALYLALQHLIDNPDECKRRGQKGRTMAEFHYGDETQAKKLADIYNRIVGR